MEATLAASGHHATIFHRPVDGADAAPREWSSNWRYYVEHRRRIRAALPPHQWLIVSQATVMMHHSDHLLLYEALQRHHWPGAILVGTDAERTIAVAQRPSQTPRLLRRGTFFPFRESRSEAVEPLVYCETPCGLVGVRWHQLAAVFDARGSHVMLQTPRLSYEYVGDDEAPEQADYGLETLARHIADAVQEEQRYEKKRLQQKGISTRE